MFHITVTAHIKAFTLFPSLHNVNKQRQRQKDENIMIILSLPRSHTHIANSTTKKKHVDLLFNDFFYLLRHRHLMAL